MHASTNSSNSSSNSSSSSKQTGKGAEAIKKATHCLNRHCQTPSTLSARHARNASLHTCEQQQQQQQKQTDKGAEAIVV